MHVTLLDTCTSSGERLESLNQKIYTENLLVSEIILQEVER